MWRLKLHFFLDDFVGEDTIKKKNNFSAFSFVPRILVNGGMSFFLNDKIENS